MDRPEVAAGVLWAGAHPVAPPRTGHASVVVATHDDGEHLGRLLPRLCEEACVDEVIVVASGCTDDTVAVVVEALAEDPRIRLFVELERSGKMAAINQGVVESRCDTVVVCSGDVLPDRGAIGRLVARVAEPGVGMAGGRPVPRNDARAFVGFLVQLLWELHHTMALRVPKVGEVAVFRREALAGLLPPTAVDEAFIEAAVMASGWKVVYEPQAVVRNWGPQTLRDFVRQRRRVHGGHLALKRRLGYRVPSLRTAFLCSVAAADLARDVADLQWTRMWRTLGAAGVEGWARLLARSDHARGKEAHVWQMVASAKPGPPRAHGGGAGAVDQVA